MTVWRETSQLDKRYHLEVGKKGEVRFGPLEEGWKTTGQPCTTTRTAEIIWPDREFDT